MLPVGVGNAIGVAEYDAGTWWRKCRHVVAKMPTLIREDGFEIMIYTRDHAPAHVHCFKDDAELIVELAPLAIRENNGMSPRNARRAMSLIAEHQIELEAGWRRIHG